MRVRDNHKRASEIFKHLFDGAKKIILKRYFVGERMREVIMDFKVHYQNRHEKK